MYWLAPHVRPILLQPPLDRHYSGWQLQILCVVYKVALACVVPGSVLMMYYETANAMFFLLLALAVPPVAVVRWPDLRETFEQRKMVYWTEHDVLAAVGQLLKPRLGRKAVKEVVLRQSWQGEHETVQVFADGRKIAELRLLSGFGLLCESAGIETATSESTLQNQAISLLLRVKSGLSLTPRRRLWYIVARRLPMQPCCQTYTLLCRVLEM